MASGSGLTLVSTDELLRLLKALHRGAFVAPVTRAQLIAQAFGNVELGLSPIVGRDLPSAIAIVTCVLSERTQGAKSAATLLHQGPAVPGTRSRDLVAQVLDLIASATAELDVLGLGLGEDRGLCRSLRTLVSSRGIRLRLALDLPASEHAHARSFLAAHDLGLDTVAAYLPVRQRLRSRVVLVDTHSALITSGELTSREDDETFDSGALIRDSAFVLSTRAEWTRLIEAGALVRVEP
jgi:hypothetical protein